MRAARRSRPVDSPRSSPIMPSAYPKPRISNVTAMRRSMMRPVRFAACAVLALLAMAAPAGAAPEGQMTWGVHISLAPTWFDPAETQGLITPFMVMYAIHDAMAKAMPGNTTAPSLAESWTMSPDGRVYDFTLRKGVKFHNGET